MVEMSGIVREENLTGLELSLTGHTDFISCPMDKTTVIIENGHSYQILDSRGWPTVVEHG